jgi:hypothetical protein
MIFNEWLMLSDSERMDAQKNWETYKQGYWHDLAVAAAEQLRTGIGQLQADLVSFMPPPQTVNCPECPEVL